MNGQGPEDDLARKVAAARKRGASLDEIRDIIRAHDAGEVSEPSAGVSFEGVEGGASVGVPARLSAMQYRSPNDPLEAITSGFTQGATLGYADEAMGALPGVTRAQLRERNAVLRERHPVLYGGAEIAGGLLPTVRGLRAAKTVTTAPSVLRAMATGAGQGSLYGAIAGFGTAEGDLPSQLTQTGVAAGVGGALGATAAPLVRSGMAAYRALTEPTADKAARVASEEVVKSLVRDGYTPEEAVDAVRRLRAAGMSPIAKPAALIDIPDGGNVRGAAKGVYTQPGPGRRLIERFIGGRRAGQTERLMGELGVQSGTPRGSPALERQRVIRTGKATDRVNYGKSVGAMGETPIDDPELLEIIRDSPDLQEAARKAVAAQRSRIGIAAMAERNRGVGGVIGESLAETASKKNVRGLFTSARDPGGGFRRADTVSEEGIVEELRSLYQRRGERAADAQYRTAVTDYGDAIQVSTGKGPVSKQAKALQNIEDWDRIIANYEDELKKRGWSETKIADQLWGQGSDELEAAIERQAMQAQDEATAAGVDDWRFDPTAEIPADPTAPVRLPRAGELQRMQQEMRRMTKVLQNENAPPGEHSDAQAIADVANRFRPLVERNIPGFGAANRASAAWRSHADAIKLGAQMHGKSPNDIADVFSELGTDAEREAFRRAYAQKELERIGKGGDVGRLYGTEPGVQGATTKLAMLRSAFADDASFGRYLQSIEAEGQIARANQIVRNSDTAEKWAFQQDLARNPLVQAGLEAGKGNFFNAAKALVSGGIERRAARLSEGARGSMAQILTETEPQTLAAYLERGRRRPQQTVGAENALARALGAYTGLLMGR